MKLKVVSVEGKGDLDKEVVWLEVLEDAKLHFYVISDTTYTDDNHISNELRHIFWFPSKDVKKGDYVALYTKNGTQDVVTNNQKTTTHRFYWKLGKTVWNKDGDCAVLFEVNTWTAKRA